MADVTFTAASVIPGTGAQKQIVQFGEASITAGLFLYQKAADSKWYIADCATSAATAAAAGIALSGGGANQWGVVQTGGEVTVDGLSISAAAGKGIYVLSSAGKCCPVADIALDDYMTIVGVAKSATNLKLGFNVSGVKAIA